MASVRPVPAEGDPTAAWGLVGRGPGHLRPASQPELPPSLSLRSPAAQRGSHLFQIRETFPSAFLACPKLESQRQRPLGNVSLKPFVLTQFLKQDLYLGEYALNRATYTVSWPSAQGVAAWRTFPRT